MKKLSFLLVIMLVFSMFTTVGMGEEAGSIYFLNYKPEVTEAFEKIAKAYQEETGVATRVVTAASGTYAQTLTKEMDKEEAPTIFVVDSPLMFSQWQEYAADLTDSKLASFLADDTYTMKADDKIYGISYALEAWGIIVNKAILNKYFEMEGKATEVTSIDDLFTFANLKAVVEDMQANKEKLGIEGVFASTSMKPGDDWRFQTHLMNTPLYWEFGDTDTAGKIPPLEFKYAENFKNIFDLYLNNSLIERKLVGQKTVSDSMAEFALGKCAMVQNGDWSWGQIIGTEGTTVKPEDVGFIPITIGVEGEEAMGLSVGASQYMCINTKSSEANQKASLAFLEWLFSSEKGKEFVAKDLQFVTPFTTMADAEYTNYLFASENEITAKGKKGYPWVVSLIPSDQWKSNYGANLLAYAQEQIDWAEVVQLAIEDWAVEADIVNANK